jgi:glutamate racemase
MENDKKLVDKKTTIGLFDSGIGGLSVLKELLNIYPEARYYYFSDDAFAPYGSKTDEFITKRAIVITEELKKQGADLIVVACNTATASSIDQLRAYYPNMTFVGVEPFLNAYSKESTPSKMAVLTTESTGKSERFKKLKERLDPKNQIDNFSLKNLAHLIEEFYYKSDSEKDFEKHFDKQLKEELKPLVGKNFTHAILGCTHYPLVKDKIENFLNLKTLSPCLYVAQRVKELAFNVGVGDLEIDQYFYFFSSNKPEWTKKSRENFLGPFKK